MYIKKAVWVGSEPTSLDMTDDGRYLFVGLRGGSSVSIINVENMEMEGKLKRANEKIESLGRQLECKNDLPDEKDAKQ